MASLSFISASKLVELVQSANKGSQMYVRVVSGNRLALGSDPMNPTISIDLSRETVGPYGKPEPELQSGPRVTRRSGEYWFEIKGKRHEVSSLGELLGKGLREIEAARPGTLEKLSHHKGRTKRIVSRDRNALFDTKHLADKHAVKLVDGWWYGTNNSSGETENWLKRACEHAGLKWGENFKTKLSEPVVVGDIWKE
jgi:hypothetical protein